MDNIAKQIAKDIVNSQMQVLEKTVAYMARKTSEDWTRMARKVMDDYYSDYQFTAQLYDRTFSMRDNIIVPVLRQTGAGWEAGVEFDYSRMDHGDMPQFREYDIFENFMYGQHGNEDYTVPGSNKEIMRNIYFTTPNARTVLDKYYQNYDAQMDKYFEEGLKLALLGKI